MQGADVNADCGAGMCALHISALRGGGKGSREVKQSLRFRLFVEPGCRGMSWMFGFEGIVAHLGIQQ